MKDDHVVESLPAFLVAMVMAAFALNWLWEMIQMPAYAEMARSSWASTAAPCAFASLGDVAMTLAVYGLGGLAAGRSRWVFDRRASVYLFAALLGSVFAVAYEWKAALIGRWSYTERMPVIPLLEVGLYPVAQMFLLVPICFWIGRRVGRSHIVRKRQSDLS